MSLTSHFGKLFQVSYVARDLDLAMAFARSKLGIEEFHTGDAEYPALVRGQVRDLKLRAAIANTEKHQFEIIQPVSGAIDVYTDGIHYDRSVLAFHPVGIAVTGPFSNWERLVTEVHASGDQFAVICPLPNRARTPGSAMPVWTPDPGAVTIRSTCGGCPRCQATPPFPIFPEG